MKEKLQEILLTSDDECIDLFSEILESSELNNQIDLIIERLSTLTIKKSLSMSNYIKQTKTINLDEDMFDKIVLAHEFGHYLYSYINYNEIKEEEYRIKQIAQENFTNHYVNGYLIDNYNDLANNKMDEYVNKEIISFNYEIKNIFENKDYNQIFNYLKKIIIEKYKIYNLNKEDEEILNDKIINILNNYSEEQIKKYIEVNYSSMYATKKAMVKINNENPRGLSMAIDLLSAIHENKYYKMKFCHSYDYYQKSIDRSLEEQYANYIALRLTNCREALNDIEKILGKEYIIFMDNLFKLSLENMEERKPSKLK